MADIYCPKCAEPWDMFELHDVVNKSFDEAASAFGHVGCKVFGDECEPAETPNGQLKAMAASAVMDMSPHPDDWVADMADLL